MVVWNEERRFLGGCFAVPAAILELLAQELIGKGVVRFFEIRTDGEDSALLCAGNPDLGCATFTSLHVYIDWFGGSRCRGTARRGPNIAKNTIKSEIVKAAHAMRNGRSTPVVAIGGAVKSPAMPVHQ